MSDHECPGLSHCVDHPKWVVAHRYGHWFAYAPYAVLNAGCFRTWREAYDFARDRTPRQDHGGVTTNRRKESHEDI